MDGATLAEVMRQRGINMRYLGKVLELVLRSPARDQLDHIYVSGAWPGRWLLLEAWNLPMTSFSDPFPTPPRKSASESSSHAPPSISSRRIYRCCHSSPTWWDLPGWHGACRRALGGGLVPS